MNQRKLLQLKQRQCSVCDVCASSYQCGKLSSALEILDHVIPRADEISRESYAEIRDNLLTTGYSYPVSVKFCDLQDSNDQINELIGQTTELLGVIHRNKINRVG